MAEHERCVAAQQQPQPPPQRQPSRLGAMKRSRRCRSRLRPGRSLQPDAAHRSHRRLVRVLPATGSSRREPLPSEEVHLSAAAVCDALP
ncbi:hypothetical protein Q5P01_018796 [Channa striata]|uniref:Uncharacterized protein n=1 Tax=Channa striata TaxID=64152 RepID=A0AA88M5M0_CHASR|nr:hypothetical protein Q5P01_018796 [Channa striata]